MGSRNYQRFASHKFRVDAQSLIHSGCRNVEWIVRESELDWLPSVVCQILPPARLTGGRCVGAPRRSADLRAHRRGGPILQIGARHNGAWQLPVLGAVAAPTAVLIRPDGHVAWVGDGTDRGLRDALATWFGPPAPGSAGC
jgi:aromatic ring hydroxylase-like protein